MMHRIVIVFVFMLSTLALSAQEVRQAEVSYVNDQSVYLRFQNTEGLSEGDTLFNQNGGQACLRIQKISSVSCLAERIANCEISKGQIFEVRLSADATPAEEEVPEELESPQVVESTSDSLSRSQVRDRSNRIRSKDRGYLNLSLNNGSTLSTNGRENFRTNFRASLKVDSLFGQNLSLEAYGNMQDFRRSYESDGENFRALIYNLALIYKPSSHHQLVVGRKINSRISSLGAIDGLQWEGNWNNWRAGAIVGSRPDFSNYGYNANLLQYGAYGAYDWSTKSWIGQWTVGLMEQRNQGAIDRRYLYTQQSMRWGKWSWFASSEIDLYENFDTAQAGTKARLTSLYLSMRYRPTSRLTLFSSYDTRQQIIFFERYDSDVERLLAEQGARQGFRLRGDYRFFRATHLGLSYNVRTNPTFGNRSQNLQAYLSHHRLPWIGGSLTYRFNKNQNGNLNSEINSLRYSRSFNSGFRMSAYYRYASYRYVLREITLDPQHYYGAELSWLIAKDWNLGIMGEYSQISDQDLFRMYLRIQKRFKF